jgi:hypothetical protein
LRRLVREDLATLVSERFSGARAPMLADVRLSSEADNAAPRALVGGVGIVMLAKSGDPDTLTQHDAPLVSSAPQVRFSLPPDTAAFTGRDEEMSAITAAVAGAAGAGSVVAVWAIGGMPGVGKTALAVHVVHLPAGRFPDRQLFIDLRAHTPGQEPVASEDALTKLLTATGVDSRFLPADLYGCVGMWRDKKASQRALLVLDNAASSSQVTPLLPGGRDWPALITSRRHLGDMHGLVAPVLMDALIPTEAQELFTRLAPHVSADPAGVGEAVRLGRVLAAGSVIAGSRVRSASVVDAG